MVGNMIGVQMSAMMKSMKNGKLKNKVSKITSERNRTTEWRDLPTRTVSIHSR